MIEDQHKDEADKDGKHNLHHGRLNILPTSVEQIYDVSKAECQGRYDDCCFQIVLLHRAKQQSAENDFFQETDTAHADENSNASGKPYCSFIPHQKAVDAVMLSGK